MAVAAAAAAAAAARTYLLLLMLLLLPLVLLLLLLLAIVDEEVLLVHELSTQPSRCLMRQLLPLDGTMRAMLASSKTAGIQTITISMRAVASECVSSLI